MRYLLTTCCAAKRPEPEPLPAVRRYVSPRIDLSIRLARRLGLPLLILSGVYGVLRGDEGVPYYDHALQPDEVEDLLPAVVDRLRELEVSSLALVVRARGTPGWEPYLELIDRAVHELGIPVVRHVVGIE